MGCDGGTIPKRDELVRTKRKREQKDKNAELMAKWRHCAISSNKLTKPIVSCELGRLYNKEAVIEYLLNKQLSPNGQLVNHIRSLKDVIELNLTEKSDYSEKDSEHEQTQDSMFICPIVGLEMNGNYKFCYIRTCGCVMSERAIKEVKSDKCHKCSKEFSESDVIILNGSEEELDALKERMNERRAKSKQQNKGKKRKAIEPNTESNHSDKDKAAIASTSTSSASSSTPSSTVTSNGNSVTKMSSSSLLTGKSSSGYSIAKDTNASETYKSLFTSHSTAKNKKTAHWVTFNPCYY